MTANWFEAKIAYMKVGEDGREKKVTESYLLDTLSYTEAEARVIKEMESVISGDYYIKALKKSNITELVESEDENDNRWYKAKVNIVDADEASGQEKVSSTYYLVAAANIERALENIKKALSTFVVPCSIYSITDTDFMDVFPYFSEEEKIPDNLTPAKND